MAFAIIHVGIATNVATAPTVYGIETLQENMFRIRFHPLLQQHLPFTVCAEGCEAAEE